jgi:hypothetical protein
MAEPDDDNEQFRAACAEHAKKLTDEFDGVTVEVCIMATCGFLYHVWAAMLMERGVSFEDYATEIGTTLGGLHVRHREMTEQAVSQVVQQAMRDAGFQTH